MKIYSTEQSYNLFLLLHPPNISRIIFRVVSVFGSTYLVLHCAPKRVGWWVVPKSLKENAFIQIKIRLKCCVKSYEADCQGDRKCVIEYHTKSGLGSGVGGVYSNTKRVLYRIYAKQPSPSPPQMRMNIDYVLLVRSYRNIEFLKKVVPIRSSWTNKVRLHHTII